MTDEQLAALDSYLDNLIADWPPLSQEQRDHVQALLESSKLGVR